jgi:mannosylglycerate hydrolase
MPGYTFHLIPHTHWDREWYLPQPAFLARLVPTLDDLITRLDSVSGSTFLLDGQTVLVEDYLRVRPERFGDIAELVRSGRLQVGPWYILADELIPSGESLIRNLLAGQSDSARLGGRTDVLYSPDAFGHPAAWPQLAGEFGIRFGVIWRGLGGEPGQEHDLYRWRGPDGREVLLYHLPPDGYEVGAGLPADRELLPRAWGRTRTGLVERAATRQVAVFVGADHHAAHPAILELKQFLEELEPESTFKISRLHDFFLAAAPEAAAVRVINGELRWSYGYTWTLQGVHGTRAPLKRRNSAVELTLSGIADPLTALVLSRGGADHRPLLDHAWRLLIQSQFHDSIGGCTSDPVARRVELRLQDAQHMAMEVARVSLNELIGNDPDRVRDQPELAGPQLVLWNPVPRRRSGVVVADVTWFRRDVLVGPPGDRQPRTGSGRGPFHLANGEVTVPVQLLGTARTHERLDSMRHYPDQDEVDLTRVAFLSPELGGLGFGILGVNQGDRKLDPGVRLAGRTLENSFLEVRVAAGGAIELIDRRARQRYPDLLTFELEGDEGDTYSYAPGPGTRALRSSRPLSVRALSEGPLVAALELIWELQPGRRRSSRPEGSVTLRLVVTLHAGSPALRCTLEIENHARDHRLRARVRSGVAKPAAIAGSQFGAVARAPVEARPGRYRRETPAPTAPAHRFVAVAAGKRGLALLTPGFFEYELRPSGDLLLTLLRSVGQLSRPDLPTRPGHAGWPTSTPEAQCLGNHRLQFAIGPVSPTVVSGGTALPELWEDLFLPVQAIWLRQASPLIRPEIEVQLEGEGLVFSAVKPAEIGSAIVLRCYNATALPAAGIWRFSTAVAAARRARADENVLHEIRLGDGGHSVSFHAAPHEIVTVVVTLPSNR